MLTYPQIDPVFFSLGPLKIHWYGIMYAVGIIYAWYSVKAKKDNFLSSDDIDNLVLYIGLGVIIGGRLGYFLFYEPAYFLNNPIYILEIYKPGMAFHGAVVGVMTAVFIFSYSNKVNALKVFDLFLPYVPVGLGLGRIGNFINGELWGRQTDMPWGMIFPGADDFLRHPSQLYEAGLEGLCLFVLLWWYSRQTRPVGAISGLFLIGYSFARITAEFFREPELPFEFATNWLTRGQLLSIPMLVLGLGLMYYAYSKKRKA